MMNKELKARWVEALRSGEYKQGAYCLLNRSGKFCCLGVLCEITHREFNFERETTDYGGVRYNNRTRTPNEDMCKLLFNDPEIPSVEINGIKAALWEHNDSGVTFDKLADAIEEQL